MSNDSSFQILFPKAKHLHKLFCHSNAVSNVPWFHEEFKSAEERYRKIFLPILLCHLYYENKIHLNQKAKTKVDSIISFADLHFHKEKEKAFKYAKEWKVASENMSSFMEPFSIIEKKKSVAAFFPIPPVDVSLIWALHKIYRKKYESYFTSTFGTSFHEFSKVEEELQFIDAFNADIAHNVAHKLQWACFVTAISAQTKKKWYQSKLDPDKTYLPRRMWPGFLYKGEIKFFSSKRKSLSIENIWETRATNLHNTLFRQGQYSLNMTDLNLVTKEFLEKAIVRYKRFVTLSQKHKDIGELIPTYDINLIRQTRSLIAKELGRNSCEKLLGIDDWMDNYDEVPEKNFAVTADLWKKYDQVTKKKFAVTTDLWKKEFDEEYFDKSNNFHGFLEGNLYSRSVSPSLLVTQDYDKSRKFLWDIICDDCKRFSELYFPRELWGVPDVTDIKISCINNANIAVAIARYNHVEGGGGPAMFIEGYTMPAAVDVRPKGGTGFLKQGATNKLWNYCNFNHRTFGLGV